ncbi:hypothetical protein SAMN05519103_09046 [Rhizobiales bacterium GAS113]|nr:hypothetical protein SAMN05519103_09046 [Rhizobiales bacterium GAS113]
MSEAFESAVSALEIGPEDETGREAVAQSIIQLAGSGADIDASKLRDKVIEALGGLRRK